MLQCNGYEVVDLGVMVPAERILEVALEEEVDVVGLSGLITPSLDQMVHVAAEMERLGHAKLLIGGATTSRRHTAVRIEPEYSGTTVHVLDASKAVGVVSTILDPERGAAFAEEARAQSEREREAHRAKTEASRLLTIGEARSRQHAIDWAGYTPPEPNAIGIREFRDYPLAELVDYVDWTPFFHAWELRGHYPALLGDPEMGEAATRLFEDAETLLDRIVSEELLAAHGVTGIFPAKRVGDDVVVSDRPGAEPSVTLHFLRQQFDKGSDRVNACLADFVSPLGEDYLGAFVVTAGHGLEALCAELESAGDDYQSILAKALADRLAEAFAERMHERVRVELWGYAHDERSTNEELIAERYVGIRPAPGYPACPDHTEKATLFRLLGAEACTGAELTESFAMYPTATVAGWYFSHPASHYFGIGRIGRDQVADYAHRKGISTQEAERWLAPSLGYEPTKARR